MDKIAKFITDLLRVFSAPQSSRERHGNEGIASVSEPSPQLFVGKYTTGDAKRLMDRLIASGIKFDAKYDVRGPSESDDGSYVDQPRVSIFVESADLQRRAAELITEVTGQANAATNCGRHARRFEK